MQLKQILIGIAFVVLIGGIYLFMNTNRNSDSTSYEPVIVPENEIPPETVTFYSASDEEAKVTFTGVDATIEYASLGTVTLREIESGTGGLYTNDTETLTLWDRGDKITIWQGEEMLFEGYGEDMNAGTDSSLGAAMWVWESLQKSDGTVFTPAKRDSFTLSFDGSRMSGETDCNGFGGSYTLDRDIITVGPLASTLMYCEGSEESVFTGALMEVDRYRIDPSGKLLLFLKNEGGSLTFRPR